MLEGLISVAEFTKPIEGFIEELVGKRRMCKLIDLLIRCIVFGREQDRANILTIKNPYSINLRAEIVSSIYNDKFIYGQLKKINIV